MARTDPTKLEVLEIDVDARLLPVWLQAWDVDAWDEDVIGPFIRLSYWLGYAHALREDRRGKLFTDHGQPVPARERSIRRD